jgi:NitT/TauT family transport system permease protein
MSARADKAPRLTVRVLHASAPFAAIAVLVIAWALIKIVFDLQDFVLPSPWRVLLAFLDAPGPFLVGSFETALSATFGFLIAVIVGVSLASALSLSRLVERSVYPLTLLFQMVPLIAIAPL